MRPALSTLVLALGLGLALARALLHEEMGREDMAATDRARMRALR